MEILRFEEATTTAPKRKKSSKGYLTIGFVATIFGLGSAFASGTIAINDNAPISLGQGVTLVTSCDDAISISPSTAMTVVAGVPTFYMTSLQINGVNAVLPDVAGVGCGGKVFDIQIFNAETDTPYSCEELNDDATAQELIEDGLFLQLTCVDSNKLSFQVNPSDSDRNYSIAFTNAPSDFSYITLVTRG
jgi:hypothetical protein